MNAMPTKSGLLEAVLSYADKGWPVSLEGLGEDLTCETCFLGSAGERDGCVLCEELFQPTTDLERLRLMVKAAPRGVATIVTGSVSGLVVVEVAPPAGVRYAVSLKRAGLLPDTLTAVTGDGGGLFFYEHPRVHIESGANRLGPGVHVHADDGKVALPPSTNRRNGAQIIWANWNADDSISQLHPRLLSNLRDQPKHRNIPAPRKGDSMKLFKSKGSKSKADRSEFITESEAKIIDITERMNKAVARSSEITARVKILRDKVVSK